MCGMDEVTMCDNRFIQLRGNNHISTLHSKSIFLSSQTVFLKIDTKTLKHGKSIIISLELRFIYKDDSDEKIVLFLATADQRRER